MSILLVLSMVLTLLPMTALAESTAEEAMCVCETACTAEGMNTDCPVCGAEGASPENCDQYTAEDMSVAKAPVLLNNHVHCICGGTNTVGDHTAHSAVEYQPWNGSDSISYTDGKAYVYLTDNATINSNLVVYGKTLYLCLNGKEYASNGTNKIKVDNGGHLVLCDCGESGVIKCATDGWGGMGIYIEAGTADIFGGKLTGGKATGNDGGGGAILVANNTCTLNIYGGEMSNNDGNNFGGAVLAFGGTVNMYGGSIVQNTAKYGGGIYLYSDSTSCGSTFNMYGGSITENAAVQDAGGVHVNGDSAFFMYDGSITKNTAGRGGGGLYINGGNVFSMNGGLLENNSSTANWDTIPANSGNLYIAGNAVMNANAGVVRGGGYAAVFNLGTIQTDDANYPATKFYSGLYNMGGVAKGGMYYGSYMAAGGNMGDCYVYYALEESWGAQARFARQFIEPGNLPTRPDDPAKAGYIFEGWRNVDGTPFDFSKPVQESMMAVAIWSECDHADSTERPTCTDSATCSVCKGTIPAKGHSFVWQTENGEYWQKCEVCSYETAKKVIPTLEINGESRVCKTQDYVFTFTLPEELSSPEGGYEFPMIGSDITITEQDGVYTGTVEASWYDLNERSFNVSILAKTEDGFIVRAEKTVTILQDHIGGEATCAEKAKCEVCGEEYGDLDPANHADLKKIPAKAATKTEEGNIEHWHCEDCVKYYADEGAEKELTKEEITLAKLSASPKTGDSSSVMLWSVLMIACASICITVAAKRKRNNR